MNEYSEHFEKILLDHFNKHYTGTKEYPLQPHGKAALPETLDRFAHSRESFLAQELLKPLGKKLMYDNTEDNDIWVIVPIESDDD